MKVEVNEKPVNKYPRLMVSSESGNIVLFTTEEKGTVVSLGNKNKSWEIGQYDDDFDMDNFTPFTGSITLSND